MKRLSPRHKFVFHQPLLLIGDQIPVLIGNLFFKLLKPRIHHIRRGFGVEVMDRQLEESAAHKAALHRPCLSFGQKAFLRADSEDAQCGLLSRQSNRNVQSMSGSPIHQFFRRITPVQSKRRFKDGLGLDYALCEEEKRKDRCPEVTKSAHASYFKEFSRFRKTRSRRRGMLLIEAGISLSILTFIGLILLKLSLNILEPRQWILRQTLTDAYITFERAYAERIPFETLVSNNSPWPAFPSSTSTVEEIGRLPGNRPITATVMRTRIPDPGNYPLYGGSGTVETNPAAMKIWKVQSVLTYQIGDRSYAKSQTVLRIQ
jgi:hypothetical protein